MKTKLWISIGIGLVCFGAYSLVSFWWHLGDNRGYAPEQPIAFSHKLHAGENNIPCQYCHSAVGDSQHATIPSTNVCMNCHSVVKTDSPEIQKIHQSWNDREPIEWVKIHDMPDHVRFKHMRHIQKGVSCESCHGDIATMDRVEQIEKLNMGFCIECHRQNEAPTGCETCHY